MIGKTGQGVERLGPPPRTRPATDPAPDPAAAPGAPADLSGDPVAVHGGRLPSADEVVAHTLLNCLLREVCGPEHLTAIDADGRLLLRLPARGVRLRVAVRRTSLLGAHRFSGPVCEDGGHGENAVSAGGTGGVGSTDGGWRPIGWRELGRHVWHELNHRTGSANNEFLDQLAASHRGVSAALAARAAATAPAATASDANPLAATAPTALAPAANPPAATAPAANPPEGATDRYLESERSLLFGHRFHPTPKARSDDHAAWTAYAPEASAAFPLRLLAVRAAAVAEECAAPGATAPLDRLHPVPDGYRLLPAHPWQFRLVGGAPALRAAIGRGEVLDLGTGGPCFAPTASVRTLYGDGGFLKFSLNVRITNCLRKNARYELAGAVALTRLLAGVRADLAERFPGTRVLGEPAYRSLALPGPDGRPDRALLEGFGVIVRDGLAGALLPGVTPLLAAAVADEYPSGPAQLSRLLAGRPRTTALEWWSRYLRLLLPPVLAAFFDHGVVFEPHLQNVLVGVDGEGMPRQVVLRDLEGTKLLTGRHRAALAALPAEVAGPLGYDERRGWDRLVYCLLVNSVAETLAVLADAHPALEPALWRAVRAELAAFGRPAERPEPLRALLAGEPLPAKANLLTRWHRRPDRAAGYVRLPSPLAPSVLSGAARWTS